MQATVDRPEGKFYVGYLSRSVFHNNLKRFGDFGTSKGSCKEEDLSYLGMLQNRSGIHDYCLQLTSKHSL